ncbi:MAG TPA: hypothetical protein VK461_14355, partial [Acidimicrobiales bacterium]|nr:hypothetical protein [Acidimicrobiales bacterium]
IEDAGLVIRERLGRDVRHHLLEPIRQHVAQHLDDEQRASAAHRHALRFAALANEVKAGAVGPEFGRWADIVERDLANFREAHRLLLDLGDVEAAVAIVDGLALVGAQRGLMEMADWCDLTVAITEGRGDRLEVAALAAAAPFWYYLNRVEDTIAIAARAADLPGDPDHHVVIEEQAVRATLDPTAWALAASRIRASLTRYDPACETWAGAYSTLYLVLLDDLDAADVAPIEARLGSSLYSAAFEFYRAIPHYLRDEDRIAAHIADQSVALARSAGAVYQLANSLMGAGGWKARLGEATIDEVFAPLLESLELWERLRIPWGRFPIVEEIAQSLAIRGRPEAAFVLWGALDASRIQAPSKVGRGRRTDAFLADVRAEDAATWMSQGAAMTFDQAVAYARRAVAAVLIAA